ncbi:MAG: Ig-like domain-containing protein, partial [Bryobacteraceae bacterium]
IGLLIGLALPAPGRTPQPSKEYIHLGGRVIAIETPASSPVIPSVHIDMPASGTTVSGTVTLAGWAIDNASVVGTAVSGVQVLVDGTAVGPATYGVSRPDVCAAYPGRPGCPYVGFSYSLNTAALTLGSHTITVSATDSASPPDTGSASVTVTVTAPAVIPSVHIDAPAPGATVSGTVTVSGWAIDNASVVGTAVSGVQVLVDGTAVGAATYGINRPDVCAAYPGRPGCPNVGYTYSLNTTALASGSHTITVSATDSASPPDTGSTTITVQK